MENNHTNQCTGTDFNELWNALENHFSEAHTANKQPLGSSTPSYLKGKNFVLMSLPKDVHNLISNGLPVGKRSEGIWRAIKSLIDGEYSDEEIIDIILKNAIGEKAHEKPDPCDWLKGQVFKARHEKATVKSFDGYTFLDDTISKAQNNCPEAIFDQPFIDTLCDLKKSNVVDFEKYRLKAKNIPGVSIGRVDKLVQSNEKKEKKSSVQNFFEVLEPNIELFRDQAGKPHIAFCKENRTKKVMSLNSPEARKQISYEIHKTTYEIIDSHALKSLMMLMEGYAENNGDVRDVFIRYAVHDGSYYIDIGNDSLDVIKIDTNGLTVVNDGPLLFRKTQTMKPMPFPDSTGDVTLLWKYIKISKSEQLLLLVWILECFRPNTQYPILELNGEKGSGKSEGSRFIRACTDPNDNEILTSPRDEQDIIAAAANNAVLCYDNLAKMNINFQNLLCSVATGGSVSTRQYFTNFDEASVKIMKPIIFNSINGLVTQNDLADRTIRIKLQKIENFIPVSELRENFKKDYPKIFSGLLKLFSNSLRRIPHIKADGKARMGDFVILGEAVSQEMGYDAGYFSKILEQMKMDRSNSNITDSVVGTAILDFLQDKEDTEEEASIERKLISEVKSELKAYSNDDDDDWPKTVKEFSNEIRGLIPMFEDIGIKIIYHKRVSRGIPITIKKISQ